MAENQVWTNNALSKLATEIVTNGFNDISITVNVEAGKGDKFATLLVSQFQKITIKEGDKVEIFKMTSRNVDALFLIRAQEGTTTQDFTTAAEVFVDFTAGDIHDLNSRTLQNSVEKVQNIDNLGDAIGLKAINIQSGRTTNINVGSGDYSVSLGYNTIAFLNSISIGRNAKGDSLDAVAIGRDTSTKYQGISIGRNATNLDGDSISIGASTQTGAYDSIAIGDLAKTFNTGGSSYADIAIGAYAEAHGNSDNYTIVIGADVVNRIGQTHVVAGAALVKKDNGEDSIRAFRQYASQENVLFSKEIDLTQVATDDIVVLSMPIGASFYAVECGLIITESNSVTVQPEVSFGINSNSTALLAQNVITISALKNRQRFQNLINEGGQSSLTVSLKVSATATTLKARFYFKGLLVEDE